MNQKQLTEDYQIYSRYYQNFQDEIAHFANDLVKIHKDAIDIEEVRQRPDNKIKSIYSLLENCRRNDKYKDKSSIFDITDIAGIRITCCCEDDYQQLDQIIYSELVKRYDNVAREPKPKDTISNQGTGKSKPAYRAIHYTFSKKISHNDQKYNIFGEIQLRTIMGNAWAILDRKYVYGIFDTGEPTELTAGISSIMEGCEKIWSVVKRRKRSKEGTPPQPSKQDLSFITEAQKVISSITIPYKRPTNWINEHKQDASLGIVSNNIPGYMEVEIIPLSNPQKKFSRNELKDFARKSQILTFGWPIGVYIDREGMAPIMDPEGIHAVVTSSEYELENGKKEKIYDYWALHQVGTFYTKTSLFEDTRSENKIFFNTRIVRITEMLMYAQRLYRQMGFVDNIFFDMSIAHGGLTGRTMSATSNRFMLHPYKYRSKTSEYKVEQQITLQKINKEIVEIVEQFTKPFFEMFDGFEVAKDILKDIVIKYIAGQVT